MIYYNSDINDNSKDGKQQCSNEKAVSFGNYIRAGLKLKIKGMLEEYGIDLLKSWFTLQVYLKRSNNDDDGDDEDSSTIRRNSSRDVNLGEESSKYAKNYQDIAEIEVTPLHLAILSRQEASLEAILESIIPLYSDISPSENTNRKTEADEILETKVKVMYPGPTVGIYSDEDCMLDGMNILHLATRYFPKGLETIIRVVRRQEGLMTRLRHLIEEKDHHVQNTPLHMAATCGCIMATRYDI